MQLLWGSRQATQKARKTPRNISRQLGANIVRCPMFGMSLAIRRCYLKRAGFWFASGKWMICDWLLPTHEITYCSLLLSGWRGYDWTDHTFSRPERWVGPVGPVGLLLFLAELCSEKKLGLPGLGHFFSTTGVERRVRRPCQELPGSFDRSESNPALHRFWIGV